jgi:carboxymethylenebutenolidase
MADDASSTPDDRPLAPGGSDAVGAGGEGRPVVGTAAGTAYLVHPDAGPGPGVLVLSSWRGLNASTKATADALADAGFTALAPDLFGAVPADDAAGQLLLAEQDPNAAAAIVLSSVVALRAHSSNPDAPVGVVGFSSGGSLGIVGGHPQPGLGGGGGHLLRRAEDRFSSLAAPVLGHFAEFDDLCTVDDRVEMQAHLLLLEKAVDVHEYPGTWHFFAEDDEPSEVAAEAAELAWERTVEFLRAHVGATADEVE